MAAGEMSARARAETWVGSRALLAAAVAGAGLMAANPAQAQGVDAAAFDALKHEVERQAAQILVQQRQIDALLAERDDALAQTRAGAVPPDATPRLALLQPRSEPVGERPPETAPAALAALPPQVSVLTPVGTLQLDPSLEYDRSSNDRLVFRGVEIVPGVNLGVVEANRAGRDTGIATLAMRYGLTRRLEVEARAPWVYRHDIFVTVAAQNNDFQRTGSTYGRGLGDVELAARYQLNQGRNGWPFLVATARVKTDTGQGPYDVEYDRDAVAQELPTGSGFWGVEGGVTMLYPTDPAIIFGSLTYLHNLSRDVDKTLGEGAGAIHVGEVDPGDSIGASLGFALSLNPRFSVSIGYSHNYIFKTTAQQNSAGKSPVTSEFPPLQVGSLLLGLSFRLTERASLNAALDVGVTSDAPDLRVVVRAPFRF